MASERVGEKRRRLILVACIQHRLADGGNLACRQVVLRIREELIGQHCAAADEVRPVIRGSASQYSVVIFGESLRFHQRLAAAIGATAEVRGPRRFFIKLLNHRLAELGHHMHGPIAEVDDLLGMAERPVGVGCAAGVSRIGATGCKTTQDGDRETRIADIAGESAVTLAHEFAIPSRKGKPDFDLDIGVAAGPSDGLHTAKGRQLLVDGIGVLFMQVERAGFNYGGLNDLGLRDA